MDITLFCDLGDAKSSALISLFNNKYNIQELTTQKSNGERSSSRKSSSHSIKNLKGKVMNAKHSDSFKLIYLNHL